MENEIWKDVKGYEGCYKVSNYGNVKSIERYVNNSDHSKRLVRERILTLSKKDNDYLYVRLSKGNNAKHLYVHRLVGEAFLPNRGKLNVINHIDEIKDNNNVKNLEWCTHAYNITYKGAMKRMVKSRNKTGGSNAERKISQYTLDGVYIRTYPSIEKAAMYLGVTAENISSVLRGKSHIANGYQWIDYNGKRFINPYIKKRLTSVIQYTMDGVLIKRYNSIAEASRMTNSRAAHIHSCCNKLRLSTNGFKWTYDPLNNKYK